MATSMVTDRARAFLAVLLALGCGSSSGVPDGGTPAPDAGDAALDAAPDATSDAVEAGTCTFAGTGDPSALPATREIINTVSERLSAPAGGLWWIAEPIDTATVTAAGDGGPVTLEVVKREPFVPDRPLATVRVPATLPAGTRLRLAGRELTVEAPAAPLALADVMLGYSYRAELGGTGIVARLPPAWRSRVFVSAAYVAPGGANLMTGIQVLEYLLLADAPRLCALAEGPDPSELFVPMWRGQTKGSEQLGVAITDADDFEVRRVVRLPR